MRICFLSSLHPPMDKRVFDKEAISLTAAGFEVIHLAPGPEGGRVVHGVRIETHPSLPGTWGRLCNGPRLFFHAFRMRADCYHCNEVDSWIVGVALKAVLGCRLVFDAHEAYPEEFAETRFPRALRPTVSAAIRVLFRLLLLFTDRVVLAKESIAPDFPAPHKVVLVRNYVSADYARKHGPLTGRESQSRRTRVIHLGLISKKRGWPQLLEAISSSARRIEIAFIGTFNDGSEPEFRSRAAELDIADQITTESWLPFQEAFRRVVESDIGIVAFQPGPYNHMHALPHKMFDYMVAGIPVIAPAFAVEVSRIVKEADCGVLVDSADPGSIREALDFLDSRPDERARLGENGRKAVLGRYNWEREAATLIRMYHDLMRPFARGAAQTGQATSDDAS